MGTRQKGGVVDADRVYNHHALAECLARSPEWVRENLIEIDGGVFAKLIGHTYYISGASFLMWIESNAEQFRPRTRKKPDAKKTVGD